MSPTTEQVFHSALQLNSVERMELVEALLTSLQPEDRLPFHESWLAVIERRAEEMKQDPTKRIPWSEIQRRALEESNG